MSIPPHADPDRATQPSARQLPPTLRPARSRCRTRACSKHADYQRAYAASRKQAVGIDELVSGAASDLQTQAPCPAGPRVGLTAGKVLGKAHERNRIKRRMREALRRHVELLPAGFDLILHPRRSVLTARIRET